MELGTTVYLNWYDFDKKTEYVCNGEVVDNSLYADTKYQDMVLVEFKPPHMAGTIRHHFMPDKLSADLANVPHDDCYLVCGKRTRAFEHDVTVKNVNASDAWQQVQQFKQEHWDYEHGHLSIDAVDEFYQLWWNAIAAKRGYQEEFHCPSADEFIELEMRIICDLSDMKMEELEEQISKKLHPVKKITAKQKRSTGRIEFQDSVQTSIFD